jgi:hypothetical protein
MIKVHVPDDGGGCDILYLNPLYIVRIKPLGSNQSHVYFSAERHPSLLVHESAEDLANRIAEWFAAHRPADEAFLAARRAAAEHHGGGDSASSLRQPE